MLKGVLAHAQHQSNSERRSGSVKLSLKFSHPPTPPIVRFLLGLMVAEVRGQAKSLELQELKRSA